MPTPPDDLIAFLRAKADAARRDARACLERTGSESSLSIGYTHDADGFDAVIAALRDAAQQLRTQEAAFMAGWQEAVNQTDRNGETHWTAADAYAAYCASPLAPTATEKGPAA